MGEWEWEWQCGVIMSIMQTKQLHTLRHSDTQKYQPPAHCHADADADEDAHAHAHDTHTTLVF